jgi:hypothetical protein
MKPTSDLRPLTSAFWGPNLSAPAQLAKVKDMTQGECARALRDPDTQPATKGALLRRLRMFNAQRLGKNPVNPVNPV